jgi:hypothetical protein
MTIKIRTASATTAGRATALTPAAAFAAGTENQSRNRDGGAVELVARTTRLVEAPAVEARHLETRAPGGPLAPALTTRRTMTHAPERRTNPALRRRIDELLDRVRDARREVVELALAGAEQRIRPSDADDARTLEHVKAPGEDHPEA